jgi:hypothetical protein
MACRNITGRYQLDSPNTLLHHHIRKEKAVIRSTSRLTKLSTAESSIWCPGSPKCQIVETRSMQAVRHLSATIKPTTSMQNRTPSGESYQPNTLNSNPSSKLCLTRN